MQPVIESARLRLRPYLATDAADVQRLAGDRRVADTTANIPHPYPDGAAERWIAELAPAFAARKKATFAVTLCDTGELIGTVALHDISIAHARAQLGYWIAVHHWGKGYCTEAVNHLIAYARDQFGITRIAAQCLARNPASARVMEKAGLRPEGVLVQHERKHGVFEDLLLYGRVLPGRLAAR
jgi:ribosomal-protein-alanine N-acetyltransferase